MISTLRKKLQIILTALLMVLLFAVPAFADVPVALTIDIDAKNNGAQIMPREQVKYNLTINNTGGRAWLRVKVNAKMYFTDSEISITDFHMLDGWKYNETDGCFYLDQVAATGRSYQVLDYFTVPDVDVMQYNGNNGRICISLYAEAIQYDAVSPDYSKDDPWSDAKDPGRKGGGGGSSGGGGGGGGGSTVHVDGSGSSTGFIIYDRPATKGVQAVGEWVDVDQRNKKWMYKAPDGSCAKNGWIYVYNPYSPGGGKCDWFCFDSEGMLRYGWIKYNQDTWYYAHDVKDGNLGMMEKGWHHDTDDGRTYYLDETTGIMHYGWSRIGESWYYFSRHEDTSNQTWFWNTTLGKWIYGAIGGRTFGSMWRNEDTPDGYHVNSYGARDGEAQKVSWLETAYCYFSGFSQKVTNTFTIKETSQTTVLEILDDGAENSFGKDEKGNTYLWLPGDSVTKTYKLRLKDRKAAGLGFGISGYSDAARDVQVTDAAGTHSETIYLGDALKCRITYSIGSDTTVKELYDGPLKGAAGSVSLVPSDQDQYITYNITVYMPQETGNEYAGFNAEQKGVTCDFVWTTKNGN